VRLKGVEMLYKMIDQKLLKKGYMQLITLHETEVKV
jgi:hypothetical protein